MEKINVSRDFYGKNLTIENSEDSFYVSFSDITEVKKVTLWGQTFTIMETNDGDFCFTEDIPHYKKLLQMLASDRRKTYSEFKEYYHGYGSIRKLITIILADMCKVCDLNSYIIEDEIYEQNLSYFSVSEFKSSSDRRDVALYFVDSLEKFTSLVTEVLPENIEQTTKNFFKHQTMEIIALYQKILGNDFERMKESDSEITSYFLQYSSDIDQWLKDFVVQNNIAHEAFELGQVNPIWIQRLRDFYLKVPPILQHAQELIERKERKAPGNEGEKRVNFALKWLGDEFTQIEYRSKDIAGDPCIILANPNFIDFTQEYDHIVVSTKEIFVIETKNYLGTINIDQNGNWTRILDGKKTGETNPIQQLRQHEKLLKSFLPAETPVVSIICIANDRAILEGVENFEAPIVKSDQLVEYIEKYCRNKKDALSVEQCQNCVHLIYKHML